jgi:RimJ/RimL family protein N-acetyltransferase
VTDAPRFVSPEDPRPDDVHWPPATWPPADGTVLRGDWVELRPTTLDDAHGLHRALDHDHVFEHLAGGPVPGDQEARRWITQVLERGWHPWTVRLVRDVGGRSAGTVVGWSSYLEISPHDARLEIGNTAYDPGVWGTVVNPETKLLLLTFAFETLGMGRVQLKTDIRNQRSQHAIARLGAKYEGVLRRYQRRADGTVRDTVLFSITAEDWPDVRQGLSDRVTAYDVLA